MKRSATLLAAGLLTLASAGAAFAVTVPYSAPFSSTTVGQAPAGWTPFGSAAWTTVNNGSANVYQATSPASTGSFGSTTQVTNLTSANFSDFTITSSFVVTDPVPSVNNEFFGLISFASAANGGVYYLADVTGSGGVRIIAQGTNADFVQSPSSQNIGGNLVVGNTYTLTLTGTYTGNSLALSFTVSGDIASGSVSKTVLASDPTALTGQYFGLRTNNAYASGDVLAVQFADFAITGTSTAIPEPSTAAALLGFVALGATALRRRR